MISLAFFSSLLCYMGMGLVLFGDVTRTNLVMHE
jgi:hypothetical protein